MARKKSPKQPLSKPVSIGSLLSLQQQDILKYQPVWECWGKAVGSEIAAYAQPEGMQKNGVLWIAVSSAVWMQELQFMKQLIVDSINRLSNSNLVKDIHLRLGDIRSPTISVVGQTPAPKPMPRKYTLDTNGREKIKEAAAGVRDPELKELIKRIADRLAVLSGIED
jgi:hypothetical protein